MVTWEWNLGSDKISISPNAAEVIGAPLSAETTLDNLCTKWIHPDDWPQQRNDTENAVARGGNYVSQFRIIHPDSRAIIWVENRATVVCDSDGKPTCIKGTAMDITRRKQAEEALEKEEQKYRSVARKLRTLVENFPDFIARFDKECRFIYVNPTVTKAFGLPLEHFAGKTVYDLNLEGGDSGQNERLHNSIKQAFQQGTPNILEATWATPGGERTFEVRHIPEQDEDGKVVSVLGIAREITERKRMEEKLRYAEALYRALYCDNPCMIFILDTEGKVLSVNATAVSELGYTEAELKGKSVLQVYYPDDRHEMAEQLQESLRHPGKINHWQLRKIRKNGDVFWLDGFARPVKDLNGKLNIMVVCLDITARKQAEAETGRLTAELEQRVARNPSPSRSRCSEIAPTTRGRGSGSGFSAGN